MPNYENGKIYELTGTDENGNKLTYIGSTTQFYLSNRLAHHIDNLKNDGSCSSKEVLKCKDYRINLIETYACKTKDELKTRERFYSDNNECVNKYKPILFEGELQKQIKKYREEHKEQIKKKQKEYREEHKEQRNKQIKEYREEHKEQLKEYNKKYKNQQKEYAKIYYEQNKEKLKEYAKKYREQNKEKMI